MKLIYCPVCGTVINLPPDGVKVICRCGSSYGIHVNHDNASYGGAALPLGISDLAFSDALYYRGDGNQVIDLTIVGTKHARFKSVENAEHID